MERLRGRSDEQEQKIKKEKPLKSYTKTALKYSRLALLGGLLTASLVKDQERLTKEESFHEMVERAKSEMADSGITSEQRKAYIPFVNDLIFEGVVPIDYGVGGDYPIIGNLGIPIEKIKEFVPNIVFGKPDSYSNKERDDAWRLYLGLPQNNDTFGISDFQPGNSKEKKYYYKINDYWKLMIEKYDKDYQKMIRELLVEADKGGVSHNEPGIFIMKDFRLQKGEDEMGTYISYYDNWNLDMFPLEKNGFFGMPFEVYDRYYYDPVTFEPVVPSLEQKKNLQNNF